MLFSVCRWGYWGSERLSNLLKTTQLPYSLGWPMPLAPVFVFKISFIYSTESTAGGAAGRGKGKSRLSVEHEPDIGLDPRTQGSWPQLKADAQRTEPPRCPLTPVFNNAELAISQMWNHLVTTWTWPGVSGSNEEAQETHEMEIMTSPTLLRLWTFLLRGKRVA